MSQSTVKKQPDESNSAATKPKRRGLSMGVIVAFIAIGIAVWSGRSHKPIEIRQRRCARSDHRCRTDSGKRYP